jgi:hypothetical protein
MDAVVVVDPVQYQRRRDERDDVSMPLRSQHFGPDGEGRVGGPGSAAESGSSPRPGHLWDAISGVTAVDWPTAGSRANTPYPKASVSTRPAETAVSLVSRGRAVRAARDGMSAVRAVPAGCATRRLL